MFLSEIYTILQSALLNKFGEMEVTEERFISRVSGPESCSVGFGGEPLIMNEY